MSASNGNGSDWISVFAEFHGRHRDKDTKKKLKFTAVFNRAMDALMRETEVPLEWRILAWIWRMAWGNNSDFCVADIGGERVGQKDCAAFFGVSKQRVSECVVLLRALNFVAPETGQRLYPIDDPLSREKVKSPDPSGLLDPTQTYKFFCEHTFKSLALTDFEELKSAEDTVKRLKLVRLGMWRKLGGQRTSGSASLIPTVPTSVNNPSVGRSETVREDRPTDRKPDLKERETQVEDWLLERFPGIPTDLDEPLLRRLAATITTDEEFAHFQASAGAIENPRKWIVFERAWNRDRKRPNFQAAAAGATGDANKLLARYRNRGGGKPDA